jgi:hypothetical protein
MENSFLKEQAARCRSLADKADQFTKRRLLDLAARYEGGMSEPSRASHLIKLPSVPKDAPSVENAPTEGSGPVMYDGQAEGPKGKGK